MSEISYEELEVQRELRNVMLAYKSLSVSQGGLAAAMSTLGFQIFAYGYESLYPFLYLLWIPMISYMISARLTRKMAEISLLTYELADKTRVFHIFSALSGLIIGFGATAILFVDEQDNDKIVTVQSERELLFLIINVGIITVGCSVHLCGILLKQWP